MVGKCEVSVTNSAYVLTGKVCSSLRGIWLCPIFIFVLYDCSFWGVADIVTMIGLWGVFTPLFGALVKGEVFWQCHLCAGNVIRILGAFRG